MTAPTPPRPRPPVAAAAEQLLAVAEDEALRHRKATIALEYTHQYSYEGQPHRESMGTLGVESTDDGYRYLHGIGYGFVTYEISRDKALALLENVLAERKLYELREPRS